MRLPIVALLAASPAVMLRGTSLPLPSPHVDLVVSSQATSLIESLDAGGWSVSSADGGTELQATRGDRSAQLSLSDRSLEGTPIWFVRTDAGEAIASALENGVAERRWLRTNGNWSRFDGGTRAATPSWVELRYGPGDAEASPAPPPLVGPIAPAALEVVRRVDSAGRRIALTFDGCATLDSSRYDAAVLHALEEAKVPATLFLGGHWAESHPDLVKRLAANSLFEIGNHSFSHPHMTRVSPARQREELLWTQRVLLGLTGKTPQLFRPPFGEHDEALVRTAAKLGLRTVEFDFPSGDPDPKFTADVLTAWVLKKAAPGSVIVMHMNGRGWHTAEALPRIVAALRKRGYEFVRVGDLLASNPSTPEHR